MKQETKNREDIILNSKTMILKYQNVVLDKPKMNSYTWDDISLSLKHDEMKTNYITSALPLGVFYIYIYIYIKYT